MSDITWTNERRKLSDLIQWPRNPRQIKERQVKRLQQSLDEFGQVEAFAVGPGNELYNGHQRLKSWASEFGDIEIDVRVASRPLTEKEREKLTVMLHTGATGGWDWDAISSWDTDNLEDWGFDAESMSDWKRDVAALDEMLKSQEPEETQDDGAEEQIPEQYMILIECQDELEQVMLLDRFAEEGLQCRALLS